MEKLVRYQNRKLYSKKNSCYVDLNYVKDLVDRKIDFEVIDIKSGRDYTKNTLKQLLLHLNVSRQSIELLIRAAK